MNRNEINYDKLDPSLSIAYDEYYENGREGLYGHLLNNGEADSDAYVTVEEGAEESAKLARVVVFFKCASDANFDDLQDTGIEINAGGHEIRTAIVPLDDLPRLTDHPQVEYVTAAEKLHLLMDAASKKVHLPEFRVRDGKNLTGKGVIIGIIDTGIDANHPAFKGRILRIWDQTIKNGKGVPEGNFGVEYSGNDLVKSKDENGHGTHVAGIAASAGKKYGGIAPEASLVVVKTTQLDAHIDAAIKYIARIAKDAPAVVNISLGKHTDAHDGTDFLSQAIDKCVRKGFIICCAAGNEAQEDIHAQAEVIQGKTTKITCAHLYNKNGSYARLTFNGWYSHADEIEVAVQTENGETTGYQSVISGGKHNKKYVLKDESVAYISTPAPRLNGDHNFRVYLTPPQDADEPFTWTLMLRGRKVAGKGARVDVWCYQDGSFTSHASPSITIGSPGCATSAITVAAYTTKTEWKDASGQSRSIKDLKLDTLAPFSSRGPRRDGKPKPDLTAPGAVIVSCCSQDSRPPRDKVIDSNYVVRGGTSMAAPFAAGVIALLLSEDPQLDPAGVLAKLNYDTAEHDANAWGRGLITFPAK